MYYEFNNVGSRVTIVYLHGWGLSGNSFDKILSYIGDVSYVKLDLLGFGRSSEPEEYFDVYEYAYQIFLLLKKLGIKNIVFVGHSFGGRLAIILSSVFDIDVKNMVLTSSAGLIGFNLIRWLKIKIFKFKKSLVNLGILNKKNLIKSGSKDYLNASKIMRKVLVKVVNQDLTFLLKNINVKVYLVWDKKDKETPLWICKKLNKNILNADTIFYKTGGHFVAFKNANKFAKLIKNIAN